MDHKISLHFDPTLYEDINHGLKNEISIFEKKFNVKIDIISLHKPLPEHLDKNEDSKLIDFFTTYDNVFFKQTKYFADSRGSFRFGNPLDSEEFLNGLNLQILIHPIWWIGEGDNKRDRVDWVKKLKFEAVNQNLIESIGFYGK